MSVSHLEAPPDSARSVHTVAPGPGFLTRLQSLFAEALASLEALARNPTAFFFGLLAVHALALPYGGFIHDAQLYGFQVQNTLENGWFTDDLFFRYGSQDRYSLFSTLAAPLARGLGLPVSFFILYLAGSALYLLGLQRLVAVLVPHRATAALATLALAVTRLPYGGQDVFAVGENFLTPRLFGIALVLLGLERLLRERFLAAALLLAFALAVHPLMAFVGLLVVVGWLLLRHLSTAQAATVVAAASAVLLAVLAYQPVGARLLGTMDAEWFEAIRRANPYLAPTHWLFADWLRIGVALATLAAALPLLVDTRVRWFASALLVAAGLGVAGSVAACWLPYALPLQAQPYRVLWLVQLVQVPLGFLVIGRWFATDELPRRLGALLLVAYFALNTLDLLAVLPLVIALGVHLLWHWSVPADTDPAAGIRPAVIGLALGLAGWLTWQLLLLVTHWHRLDGLLEPLDHLRTWSSMLSPVARVAVLTTGLLVLSHVLGTGMAFRVAALALCLAVQLGSFAVPHLDSYTARFRPIYADLRFVREHLAEQPPAHAGPPTVYWPLGRIEHVWLDLQANCYFEWAQLSGNCFHRGTALEGERRISLVKRFEIDNFRRHALLLRPTLERNIQDLLQVSFNEPPPSREDMLLLCQDVSVDFLILRQEFAGLWSATNGSWFIYNCQDLRARGKHLP